MNDERELMDEPELEECDVMEYERVRAALNQMRFDAVDAAQSDSEQAQTLRIYEHAFDAVADCEASGRGWESVSNWLWYTCPAKYRQGVMNVLVKVLEEQDERDRG